MEKQKKRNPEDKPRYKRTVISVLREDDDALEMKAARRTEPIHHATSASEVSPKKPQRHAEVKYPDYLMSSFLSFLVFIMAATMRGINIHMLYVHPYSIVHNKHMYH